MFANNPALARQIRVGLVERALTAGNFQPLEEFFRFTIGQIDRRRVANHFVR